MWIRFVDADPGSNIFLYNMVPDPTFQPDADPDPSIQIKVKTLEKGPQIGSYFIPYWS
jgi:hypothetical protein